jgi:hypothetical protein
MKNGNARHAIEAGSDHIKILTHPDQVRIGVIGIKDRVFVSPVAQIGNPWLAVEEYGIQNKKDREK